MAGSVFYDPKYAILYPDAGGCLYVQHLGVGEQGAAVLVQSVITGELYVYKKASVDPRYHRNVSNPNDCPELFGWRPHPLIPTLVDSNLKLRSMPYDESSMTLVTRFCNGGALHHFAHEFFNRREAFPEVVLFRALDNILQALDCLHHSTIPVVHGDGVACNIFLHWTSRRLPNFFLGDLGRAKQFDLAPRPNGLVPIYHNREAFLGIIKDLETVASLIRFLTADYSWMSETVCSDQPQDDFWDFEENDQWKKYSQKLHDVYYTLMAFILQLQDEATQGKPAQYNASALRREIAAEAGRLEKEYIAGPPAWWEKDAAILESKQPMLFDSLHDLQCVTQEHWREFPGPWHVASVDPISLKVLEVSPWECHRQVSGREAGR